MNIFALQKIAMTLPLFAHKKHVIVMLKDTKLALRSTSHLQLLNNSILIKKHANSPINRKIFTKDYWHSLIV